MASFNDFLSALRGAPTTGAQLNKDEAKLLAERQRVATAKPHIDDVVEVVLRGLRNSSADALERLSRYHLNADSLAATHNETLDNCQTFNVLAVTRSKPYPASSSDPKGVASIIPQGDSPDLGLVTHFLMPVIEPAVKALVVERLGDACKGGLRASDRKAKLAAIEEKLAGIRKQRADLVEGLREAARHVAGAPEALANGPSDAAVAAEVAEYELATGARVVEAQ